MILDTSKPVDRTGNSYCGPLVVGAILGTSTGYVAESVLRLRREGLGHKRARKSGAIKGTYADELLRLLAQHGYRTEQIDIGARYRRRTYRETLVNDSFTRWASREPLFSTETWHPATLLRVAYPSLGMWLRTLRTDATYIVHLPRHWAIASAGKWSETHTDGKWIDFRGAPGRARHVTAAYLVKVRHEG